jgi:CheY-like chemotaxis protein
MDNSFVRPASGEVDVVNRDCGCKRGRRLGVFAVFLAPGSRLRISGFPYLPRDAAVAMISAVAAHVLVVDDDPRFRSLAARLLGRAGLQVAAEADTVERARELVHEVRPAFVLLDVSLPDGDGVALAGELLQLPWRPRVVLVSSDHDVVSSAGLDQSGAVAFIPKDELTDAVLRVAFALA